MDINSLIIFAKVADHGSFTSAARQLKVPKSLVSRKVSTLEEELNLRLLHRTTRNVSLTDEGQQILEMVNELEEHVQAIATFAENRNAQPTGVLRITAAHDFGIYIIREIIPGFVKKNPEVKVNIELSNLYVDLVEEGFDLALRATTAPLRDSSLVATKIGETPLKLYAHPNTFQHHHFPSSVEELNHFPLIQFQALKHRRGQNLIHLTYGEKTVEIRVESPIQTNDMLACKQAALAGVGIALLPELMVTPELREGNLLPVFPEWSHTSAMFYALRPGRRHIPAKTNAFIQYLLTAVEANREQIR